MAAFHLPEAFLADRPITSPDYQNRLLAHTEEMTWAWRPARSPGTTVPAPPTPAVPEATRAAEHTGGTR